MNSSVAASRTPSSANTVSQIRHVPLPSRLSVNTLMGSTAACRRCTGVDLRAEQPVEAVGETSGVRAALGQDPVPVTVARQVTVLLQEQQRLLDEPALGPELVHQRELARELVTDGEQALLGEGEDPVVDVHEGRDALATPVHRLSSIAAATSRRNRSAPCGATTWMPTGSPSGVVPNGNEMAGQPVTVMR